ncbi:hypothetical protein QNI16_06740 [Cytophagaceae bacterium YF14B1]|uniref:YbbR-like domain-containing protein n=1 Tax=Xanthocytophaga flava TaxID=3048013 RepID=A0AAE3QNX7_9BACT|nr:hypothetical protein [Xanthocytophaga flavus]MDJ1480174.1 hypothetical protein [Xanthocytophaga flavus]
MIDQKNIWRKLLRSLVVTRSAEFPVVALCFLAATTFWFLNALNKEYTTKITYPIEFEYNKEQFVSTVPLPSQITLNVTGYGWTLLRKTLGIDTQPIVYHFENPLKTAFITRHVLLPAVTEQLKEAKINYIENDTIPVAFDKKMQRKVALQVDNLQLELKENYFITDTVQISPDTITFEGPAQFIKELPDLLIINVPGKNIDEDYEEEVTINYTQNPLISLSSDKVTVRFRVREFLQQTVEVPVEALRLASNKLLHLPNQKVEVDYWLLPEDEPKTTAQNFGVVADLSKWNKADSSISLALIKKPDWVRNVTLRPATLKLVK